MNIEQRFSADMDRYFRKKERDRYLCCRLAMSANALRRFRNPICFCEIFSITASTKAE